MSKQVDKSVYSFGRYTKIDRWSSYFYQIRELLNTNPKNILEIGVGEGVVKDYLKNHSSIKYTSFDIAEDLEPDIVGDVTSLPFEADTYDTVCAFEVLEHLPFDVFEKALSELLRVSKNYTIISLPHFGPPLLFDIKIPFLPRMRIVFKIPFSKVHIFDGQHYWEIGKKGYAAKRVRRIIQKHAEIVSEFIPFENQYHHFFVLKKR